MPKAAKLVDEGVLVDPCRPGPIPDLIATVFGSFKILGRECLVKRTNHFREDGPDVFGEVEKCCG